MYLKCFEIKIKKIFVNSSGDFNYECWLVMDVN